MDDSSTDIFGPVEENSDDSVEVKSKRGLRRNTKKTRLVASSKRKEKLRTINQTMIQQVGHGLYWNKVQQFLDRGKSQTYAVNAAFNALLRV